jgi:hypothetical protein
MSCKNCDVLRTKLDGCEHTNASQADSIAGLEKKLKSYDDYSIAQHTETIKMQARLIKFLFEWVEKLEGKK